jgi:hypothetical protein
MVGSQVSAGAVEWQNNRFGVARIGGKGCPLKTELRANLGAVYHRLTKLLKPTLRELACAPLICSNPLIGQIIQGKSQKRRKRKVETDGRELRGFGQPVKVVLQGFSAFRSKWNDPTE